MATSAINFQSELSGGPVKSTYSDEKVGGVSSPNQSIEDLQKTMIG